MIMGEYYTPPGTSALTNMLGNALALIDPNEDEELIKESVNRIRAVAEYVRAQMQEPDLKN